MTDQNAQPDPATQDDFHAPAAHASDENPLDRIGEPVADPLIPGAERPAGETPES